MPCLTSESLLFEMKMIKFELWGRNLQIEPCMNMTDLVDFEETHMIRFPADYRMFLLEIGDGVGLRGDDIYGDDEDEGPCKEGILAFGKTPVGFPLRFTDIINNLKTPFPYESKSVGDSINSGWSAYLPDLAEHTMNIGGYVTLGTALHSSDRFWILICQGFCRGEVWIATKSGSFFPCTPRMTFKDWLKDWIENDGHKMELSLINTGSLGAVSEGEVDNSEDAEVEDILNDETISDRAFSSLHSRRAAFITRNLSSQRYEDVWYRLATSEELDFQTELRRAIILTTSDLIWD